MDLDMTLVKSAAQKMGISESNIIHEYYELRLLEEISNNFLLSKNLIFKGGTALRLVYLSDRYSDDLDFDLKQGSNTKIIMKELLGIINKLGFSTTDKWEKKNTILFELSYGRGFKKIKIEISKLPKISTATPVIKNIINHIYPASININTYPLEILMAGKIAAVLQRERQAPRDIYDLFFFLSNNIEFDLDYLNATSSQKYSEKFKVFNDLLNKIDTYGNLQIKNELNILLPKSKRDWTTKNLKPRLKEILALEGAKHVDF